VSAASEITIPKKDLSGSSVRPTCLVPQIPARRLMRHPKRSASELKPGPVSALSTPTRHPTPASACGPKVSVAI
jgi:hypothetical protein